MGNNSNQKRARVANIKGREVLETENVEVKNVTEKTGRKEYSTGAAAFADFFDKIADEANRKAQKELEKPKYRFLEERQAFIICEKENRNRAVIVKKATGEAILFDKNVNILSEFKENECIKDIVDLRYPVENDSGKEYENIDIDEESGEFLLKDYEQLELVPVATSEHQNVYLYVDELDRKLKEYKYHVAVYEDLECTNVTDDNRYYIRISKDNRIYVDIDLLKYEEDIKDFSFDEQAFIENKICRIEGSNSTRTKIIAGYIADYIAHIMYFREFYTLKYKKIGWDYYEWDANGWIFKYDKIYSKLGLLKGEACENCAEGLDIKGEMVDIEQAIANEVVLDQTNLEENVKELSKEEKRDLIYKLYGKEFEWIGFTRKLINTHPYDALILGAGISGIVRQLLPYTKETNININIVGAPASGKSTICHYLLGIFGNPVKIEGSFIDTANSMEQVRIKRPVLPYVLDERMLRIEGSSEKEKAHTVLMDIFREYEGKVKERLGKQYEESSGERTFGPIISSSVKCMMDYVFEADDLGQYRRFIEFDIGNPNSKVLFDDDKQARKAETIAYHNYGYGIRIIIDYMLEILEDCDKDANVIYDRFIALDEKIKKKLTKRQEEEKDEKVKFLASSSERFALIVLSYQILREALNYYDQKMFENMGEGWSQELSDEFNSVDLDNTDTIIELLINNLVLKMKKTKQKADVSIENNLYTYILHNSEYFFNKSNCRYPKEAATTIFDNKDKYLGFVEIKDNEIELTTIMLYQLDQFWAMDIIPEPKEILRYIKEVDEQGISSNDDAVAYGEKEYHTNGVYAQKNFKDSKRAIIGRTNYPISSSGSKTTDFYKRTIRYVKPVDEEKRAGEE